MIFFYIFLTMAYVLIALLVVAGAFALVWLPRTLSRLLQQHSVGKWLLGPFRSWTGLDETRRPKH